MVAQHRTFLTFARDGSWRGVGALQDAAGTGTTHFPVPVEEAKSIASRVKELLLRPGLLRVRVDHGERLRQEEQEHDDALLDFKVLAVNPFPTHSISDMEFGQDTVPTPPRAAADRLRALGYLVWMRTIGT